MPPASEARGRAARFYRAPGILLAIGAGLLVAGLVTHPIPSPDPVEYMDIIADHANIWAVSHAFLTLGAFVAAIGILGLVTLRGPYRPILAWLGVSFLVMAVWVSPEFTVMIDMAETGDAETFSVWEAAVRGVILPLLISTFAAIAVLAWRYRAVESDRRSAPWSWLGIVGGAGGVLWVVGAAMLAIRPLGPFMFVGLSAFGWLAWFGTDTARTGAAATPRAA